MCLDIIKNPVKSLSDAKRVKNLRKSVLTLIETSVLFALASGIVVAGSGLSEVFLLGSIASVFAALFIGLLLLSVIVNVVVTTLGGKGKFFEGLTVVSYSMLPIGLAVFVSAIASLAPFTGGIQLIILALGFALGLSMLYRGIKELYKTDMITSFVAVSVTILTLLLATYASVGLSMLTNIATIAPV